MLQSQVLGAAGRDNALYVRADSGQQLTRLLFDCGAGVAAQIGRSEAQQLDYLCFSHLHMDHVAGFDGLFRMIYARTERPNRIYGPPGTMSIMQHRFQGFLWNLEAGAEGGWDVFDIYPERIEGARFLLGEAFAVAHPLPTQPRDDTSVLVSDLWTLHAVAMDHMTPSLAYVLREQPRANVDTAQLAARGFVPGAWLQQLKSGSSAVTIDGVAYEGDALRAALLSTTPGESLAYCTDFLLDDTAVSRLLPLLSGVDTLFCESQYRGEDAELAQRNFHMTAPQVATLARDAQVGHLTLIHTSERYRAPELQAMLAEAQAIFPTTSFPAHWHLSNV